MTGSASVNVAYCCLNREVSGLGLSGTMGYLLSDLLSLRKLCVLLLSCSYDSFCMAHTSNSIFLIVLFFLFSSDLSDNNFHDIIPYQLPPNLTSL